MQLFVNVSFLSLKSITGTSRFALGVCRELKKQMGDSVTFLAPKTVAHPDIIDELNILQIGPSWSRFFGDINKARLLWEQTTLPIYLLAKGSPLLLSLGHTAPLYYKNQIVTVLDLFYEHYKDILPDHHEAYTKREVQFPRFMIPRILRVARRVITISEYSKQDIINHFGIDSSIIDVVYPSIADIFLEKKYKETPNIYGKYILGVSSVNPHKNFEGLITAFKRANLQDLKLIIVGKVQRDAQKYSLYNSLKDDRRVIFTDYISDDELTELYRNALFFIFPSFFEGFGIPPLEAMACGCPTIVSNKASLPEICGDASMYVDPYDTDTLVSAIKLLYRDNSLRQDLAERGLNRVKLFDKKISSSKLVDIVNSLS